ncbi:MAG: hypothetical protein JNK87_35895 [Bryobacterales bacterium]|nr:hypothetical protein [Bryobacterales bacterium]
MKLVSAVLCLLLALLAPGCSNPSENLETLPMILGEWRRTAVENIPAEEHTQELKRMGIKRSRRAFYEKNGERVDVSIYQYGASAAAFEMVQKWRPQPGSIATSKGTYFIVLSSKTAPATTLNAVASLVEGNLRE